MVRIEKIISRGIAGPELAALAVARLYGLATGGHTRIFKGKKSSQTIRLYGLSADPCSRRQAIRRNIRQSGGTLIIGRFGKELEATIRAEGGHFFCLQLLSEEYALRFEQWLQRHEIRTLNVIGSDHRVPTGWIRHLLCNLLRRQGRTALTPTEAAAMHPSVVLADDEGCYAVVPWLIQRAWRWHETRGIWTSVKDWKSLPGLRGATPSSDLLTQSFWKALPQQIRQWITLPPRGRQYDRERTMTHDLEMVEVLGRLGKPALDLAQAGRWAILQLVSYAGSPQPASLVAEPAWDVAARLLAGRQRDLLGHFGFPATESAVRVLAKVSRPCCDAQVLEHLRLLMWDQGAHITLQRLPRINKSVLAALLDPWLRRVLGWPLLRELAAGAERNDYRMAGDIEDLAYRLQTQADRTGQRDRIGTIDSSRSLARIVSELEIQPNAGWPLPPPALPGIGGVIEPLLDGRSVAMEGRVMQHCAAEYRHDVRRGHSLMFRILPDATCDTERATLELRPGPDGLWCVAQLKGVRNAPVGPDTNHFVETWLFFAHCDPAVRDGELRRACLAELASANTPGREQAA